MVGNDELILPRKVEQDTINKTHSQSACCFTRDSIWGLCSRVGNLSVWLLSRGSISGLDLAVSNLGGSSLSTRSLDLTIVDLGCSGLSVWSLSLTVSNLRCSSLGTRSLNLTIVDLRDGGLSARSLDLTIVDLGDSRDDWNLSQSCMGPR